MREMIIFSLGFIFGGLFGILSLLYEANKKIKEKMNER